MANLPLVLFRNNALFGKTVDPTWMMTVMQRSFHRQGRPLLRRGRQTHTFGTSCFSRTAKCHPARVDDVVSRAPVAARRRLRSRAKKAPVAPLSPAAVPAPQSILALNNTLSRFATQRVSEPPSQHETPPMMGWAASRPPVLPQRSVKPMDPNDPFSHFFETEFDTPGKFDIPAAGELARGPRTRGGAKTGLMLATSCRSRR